jgi:hypothetical protein
VLTRAVKNLCGVFALSHSERRDIVLTGVILLCFAAAPLALAISGITQIPSGRSLWGVGLIPAFLGSLGAFFIHKATLEYEIGADEFICRRVGGAVRWKETLSTLQEAKLRTTKTVTWLHLRFSGRRHTLLVGHAIQFELPSAPHDDV